MALGAMDRERGEAIATAADEMHAGALSEHLIISLMEGSGGLKPWTICPASSTEFNDPGAYARGVNFPASQS